MVLSLVVTALPMAGEVKAAVIEVNPGDSIQDAINAAAPGDTILVNPGTYTENLTIGKSLTVVSSDGAGVTTIEGSVGIDLEDAQTAVFGIPGAGFTVTGATRGIDAEVEYWSSLSIAGNTFTGNDHGIYVTHVRYFSELAISNNIVTQSQDQGIYLAGSGAVRYHSSASIIENIITDNGDDGIYWNEVFDSSHGLIQGNTITGNGDDGIWFDEVEQGSVLEILGNTVSNNTGQGIYIRDCQEGSEGLIQGNTITDNGSHGLYMNGDLDEGSLLTVEDNDIERNGGYGFRVYDVECGSYLAFIDNRVRENTSFAGVYIYTVENGGEALIEGNTITGNGGPGLYVEAGIDDGSSLIVQGNTISSNGGHGVEVGDTVHDDYGVMQGSSLSIMYNDIGSNTDNGIHLYLIKTGGQVLIEGNTASGNNYGVFVGSMSDGGSLDVVENVVAGNSSGGVYAGSEIIDCEVSVLGNTLSGNTGIGLQIGEGETLTDSMATIRCNTIYNNTEWGIYLVAEHSLVDISGNHILANGTSGTEGGIYIDGSDLDLVGIHQNSIASNYDWGLRNDSTDTVDATYNWWGSADGPNPPGSGDSVAGNVSVNPWLTQEPALCSFLLPPIPSPTTITVDGGGGADYTVIQDAIDDADPGDIILVSPGTYTEDLTIVNKWLTIISTDGATSTTIDGTVTINLGDLDNESVIFGEEGAGFTVTGNSPGFDVNVQFWSHLTIEGNVIDGCTGDGIEVESVTNWSSLSVVGNEIRDNGQNGLFVEHVWYFSELEVIHNEVTGNAGDGTRLAGHDIGAGEYEHAVQYQSSAEITDNRLTDNGGYGIYWNAIRNNSYGSVQRNTITGNGGDGFLCHDTDYGSSVVHGSSLDILDNSLSSNGGNGINIRQFDNGSHGFIRGNTIATNAIDGLHVSHYVQDGSQLTIRDNAVTNNAGSGLNLDEVDDGSSLRILDNVIADNGERGIRIYDIEDGSLGLIQGNTIRENGSDGVYIDNDVDEGSRLTVQGNTIANNSGFGFRAREVENGAYLAVIGNEVTGNAGDGLFIRDVDRGSEALIEGNTISSNDHGIYIQDKSLGGLLTVDGNDISGNASVGLWLCGDADTLKDSMVTVRSNSILQNNGWGVYCYVVHSMVDVSGCNQIVGNAGGGIYIDGSDLHIGNSPLFLVAINHNDIEGNGNSGYGVLNESGELIDATNNWWGDPSGPFHPMTNATGQGDTVSNDVVYDPWRSAPCSYVWSPVAPEIDAPDVDTKRTKAPEPANLALSNLVINPTEVLPTQEVTITAMVCNSGDLSGIMAVDLLINGVAEQSKTVGVSGGSCQPVTFTVARTNPGTYEVSVNGMPGQFSVIAPTNVPEVRMQNVPPQQAGGLGTAGIIAIIAVCLALIAALVFMFRRT